MDPEPDDEREPKAVEHRAGAGWLLALLLAVAVGLLHGLTVRPGHTWWGMDDYTAYLLHGRALLEGRPYGDIDTVHDAELPPAFQRTAFPPLFSLVVGAVDRVSNGGGDDAAQARGPNRTPRRETSVLGDARYPYGLDIVAIKRVNALFLALAVLAIYGAFRRTTDGATLGWALVTLALVPYLFAFRELVRAEALFLLLLYLWFQLVQRTHGDEGGAARRYGAAVLAGVVLVLAYSTRTAAIVLPPTLVLHDLLRTRRIRATSWVLLVVAAGGILAQRAAFASVEGGYLSKAIAEFGLATFAENFSQLRWNYARIWENGFSPLLRDGVMLASGLLAAVGFVARLRRPAIFDVFFVLYMGMILALPTDSAWMRYLIPALPVAMLYLFTGVRMLAGTGRTARQALTMGTAAVVLLVSFGGAYANMNHGPLPDGLDAPATVEAFDWVADHTQPDDVVVFAKSRTLTLATGRPSLSYPHVYKYGELSDAEQWAHIRRVQPVFFVLKHTPPTESSLYRMLSHSDQGFIADFVANYPEQLPEVFRNDDFAIYALRGFPEGT